MELEDTFLSLLNKHSADSRLASKLWIEVELSYSNKKRFYHNLLHLDHVRSQLLTVRHTIANWDGVLFALFYHDIVYDPLKKSNEEKSARLAERRLNQLNIPQELIDTCRRHILATKAHQTSEDTDTNFFTDADLSILGCEWNAYNLYRQQVRKEYSIYPDLIFKPGRKKILQHFLQMKRIFKTDEFFTKYESSAKLNLEKELNEL